MYVLLLMCMIIVAKCFLLQLREKPTHVYTVQLNSNLTLTCVFLVSICKFSKITRELDATT